ncbi:MAG: hypothetical protein ABFD76_05085 [Smithella sp.]
MVGKWLLESQREKLAIDDGFNSFHEMILFFQKEHHELPFNGLLYKW